MKSLTDQLWPTPKFPLSHGWANLLSGRTLVVFDLKASLGWTSPRWSSGRVSPKRDASGDWLCWATLPNNLPATSPGSAGRFLQRFRHSRCRARPPDDLIRAPAVLDSALAPISRPSQDNAPPPPPFGEFFKNPGSRMDFVGGEPAPRQSSWPARGDRDRVIAQRVTPFCRAKTGKPIP